MKISVLILFMCLMKTSTEVHQDLSENSKDAIVQKPRHSKSQHQTAQDELDKLHHVAQENSRRKSHQTHSEHQVKKQSNVKRDQQIGNPANVKHTNRNRPRHQVVKKILSKQFHNGTHHKNVYKRKNNEDHQTLTRANIIKFDSPSVHNYQVGKKHVGPSQTHNQTRLGYKTLNTYQNKFLIMLNGIKNGIEISENYKKALANEFFTRLRKLLHEKHLNIISLPKRKIVVKHNTICNLISGKLTNLAELFPVANTVFSFNKDEGKVTLGFQFSLTNLKFFYNYHVGNYVNKNHGFVRGSILNTRFNIVISYYYSSNRFTLDHLDEQQNGNLTLKFHGHKFHNWIVEPITKAFTHNYHLEIIDSLKIHLETTIRKNIDVLKLPV